MKAALHTTVIPLRTPLFRGERRLRIALVGMPNSGKSTTIGILDHFFCRSGYEVLTIKEGASACPISKKSRFRVAPGVTP